MDVMDVQSSSASRLKANDGAVEAGQSPPSSHHGCHPPSTSGLHRPISPPAPTKHTTANCKSDDDHDKPLVLSFSSSSDDQSQLPSTPEPPERSTQLEQVDDKQDDGHLSQQIQALQTLTENHPSVETKLFLIPTHHKKSSARKSQASSPKRSRRKSLPAPSTLLRRRALAKSTDDQQRASQATTAASEMRRGAGQKGNEDLFLELANDEVTQPSSPRRQRASSRASLAAKHRSLPPPPSESSVEDHRPLTAGQMNARRTVSQVNITPSDGTYPPSPLRDGSENTTTQRRDATGASRFSAGSRAHQYSDLRDRTGGTHSRLFLRNVSPERSQLSSRRLSMASPSPETLTAHRRHVSSKLNHLQSVPTLPAFERKTSIPDSASVDSETAASTVWDEIDDLKSRIKKIELTGKMPTTSGAAVSAEQSERPRTATTAPTTIDSSPKHERTVEKNSWTVAGASDDPDAPGGGANVASIHPMLHAALSKAKSLLNPTLYRQLEATASDALHLAVMTGSAGPQGTAFSAASIIHGVTISDRQIRRKADTMCRNMTDLILALCEGKHESSSLLSSPANVHTPTGTSPALRFPRSSSRQNSISRPMSRLEARRSSILGGPSTVSRTRDTSSALEIDEDLSASEQDSTAPPPSQTPRMTNQPNRFSRASSSRLQTSRVPRFEDISDPEDPTIRPLSRARTDAGRDSFSRFGNTPQIAHRSPSLRESLAARRAHHAAAPGMGEPRDDYYGPQPSRVARSLSSAASTPVSSSDPRRRGFHDATAGTIMEESGASSYTGEGGDEDMVGYDPPAAAGHHHRDPALQRRAASVRSSNLFGARRGSGESGVGVGAGGGEVGLGRTESVSRRRRAAGLE